jgi:acetate kinase
MSRTVLAVNAGSSSIKFALYDVNGDGSLGLASRGLLDLGDEARLTVKSPGGELLTDRRLDGGPNLQAGFGEVMDWIDGQTAAETLIGVGHRVVHGGLNHSRPLLLTPTVIEGLEALTPLAPLHQPRSLAPIRALGQIRPGLPQVGCFDTAFHRTIATTVSRIALPRRYEAEGVRRYGFHGLSYEYIAQTLVTISADLPGKRTIVAHLGNGASLCAMQDGSSVDTTMGFSALDGLVMGTRCGGIDPGVLLHLLLEKGMKADELQSLLYRQSGLLGVSGISGDIRTLLASQETTAREALDLFAFRAARETAALANTLGGLECLVFTAGIGENAPPVRAAICARLGWLGVRIDAEANRRGEARVSTPDSAVEVRIIPTDEESIISKHTLAVLCS